MGVRGLWKILEPAGRVVPSPDSLSGQTVAVDASIWLYQFLRALPPGSNNNPLVLAGLFQRLCKLLYFGMKPILVFDGAAPTLKRQTTKERASRRGAAEERYRRIARKIIATQIHLSKLQGQTGDLDNVKEEGEAEDEYYGDFGSENDFEESVSGENDFDVEYLQKIDVSSPDFANFPIETQQEILLAKRELVFKQSLSLHKHIDALDFSKMQVDALVKRRKIAAQLEKVKEGTAVDFEADYMRRGDGERIAADSTRRYILVKKNKKDGGGWVIDATTTSNDLDDVKDSVDKRQIKRPAEEEDFDSLFGQTPSVVGRAVPADTIIESLVEKGKDPIQMPSDLSFNPETYLQPSSEEPILPILQPSSEPILPILQPSSEPILPILQPSSEPILPIKIVEIPDPSSEIPKQRIEESKKISNVDLSEILVAVEKDKMDTMTTDSSDEEVKDMLREMEAGQNELLKVVAEEIERKDTPGNTTPSDHLTASHSAIDTANLIAKLQDDIESLRSEAKHGSHATTIDNDLMDDFRELLTIMGIPWIIAPGEAEAQCAWLQRQGHVNAIITDDSDVFLFGATQVYRHLFNNQKRIGLFLTRDIERELSLTRMRLVVLSMLLGSDYSVGVHGMGPAKSYKLMKILNHHLGDADGQKWLETINAGLVEATWPTIEDPDSALFLERLSIQCALPPDHTLFDPKVFKAYMNPDVDQTVPTFRWKMLSDLTRLDVFLRRKLRWSEQQCRKVIDPIVLRQINSPSSKQTTMDKFLYSK